ncbi:riboflavin synthase [Halorussus halophilus]|uniref:riboflavin synthase n=1 Tax=Halorussus halophilus TaxID=2650975 RepID=UPI00130103DB|nr:riboflavin synthase [Halorussus halophilus]
MFTGIVEESGEVRDVTVTEDGRRLTIGGEVVTEDLERGQSISVSGVCLTVEEFGGVDASADASARRTESDGDWFEVFLAAETVAKTYLGAVEVGDPVNLERAMPADGRFDGHVVQGHVDTTTEVVGVEQVGEDWQYEFAVPDDYAKYVVDKGSVTLDGISLTVADLREDTFTVAIIPETRAVTNLSEKGAGDPVHLEVDVIAKYTERMLSEAGTERIDL